MTVALMRLILMFVLQLMLLLILLLLLILIYAVSDASAVANGDADVSGVRPRSKAFGEKETSCQPCHQVIGEEQALIL